MENKKINIAEINPKVTTLGPGNRFALWVQGCPFNCKDCISPNWINLKKGSLIEIDKIVKWINESTDIYGITISGGEPFLQGSILAELLKKVKNNRPELNVIVFTGFEFEQLTWPEADLFLKYIDVVITGLYVDKLNDNKGLRGSSNQSINYLTNRLRKYNHYFEEAPRELEFHINNSGTLMVGIPEKGFKW